MGNLTQFQASGSEECDVVIGFDFGTSCSKVVFRTPFHFGEQAYAVSFGNLGHPSCRHLLPSVLWASETGEVTIDHSPNSVLLRDIKYHLYKGERMPSLNGHRELYDTPVVAVAFLAIALRASRQWFLGEHEKRYGEFNLRWSFNLGMPSADYADKELCATFEKIANAAWWLSVQDSEVTLNSAERALASPDRWSELNDEDSAEVTPIPEVAAEVEGYRRSDVRDDGLHMLVDIGATTLDVCSFVLHKQDDDYQYALLTADVEPIGAMRLYQTRVDAVHQAVNDHVSTLWNQYDPVSPMSDELEAYAPDQANLSKSLTNANTAHATEIRQMIWKTILDLKKNRDPNSNRWVSELPVFVTGGGSAMPFYKSAMDAVSQSVHTLYMGCAGINQLALQKPDNLVADVDNQVYHRLAVAWGLSYTKTDIGDVTRPSEIADVAPREKIDPYEGFISKDMV